MQQRGQVVVSVPCLNCSEVLLSQTVPAACSRGTRSEPGSSWINQHSRKMGSKGDLGILKVHVSPNSPLSPAVHRLSAALCLALMLNNNQKRRGNHAGDQSSCSSASSTEEQNHPRVFKPVGLLFKMSPGVRRRPTNHLNRFQQAGLTDLCLSFCVSPAAQKQVVECWCSL